MTGAARLLCHPGNAAWNMALDESLLAGAPSHPDLILRLYRWPQPALTLGRFQDAGKAVDRSLCRQLHLDVTRRPTGGRAVYHSSDLTYALLFPEAIAGGTSIRGSYRLITSALAAALERAGVMAVPGSAGTASSRADCFAHTSMADLADSGQKLVGSAQVRRSGWVLQQGSVRLWPLAEPPGLFRHNGGIAEDLNYHLSYERIEELIANALAELLGVRWQADDLRPEERRLALSLAELKYSCEAWVYDGQAPI